MAQGDRLDGIEWCERAALADQEREAVRRLAARCNQHDGTDLKLAYGERSDESDGDGSSSPPICFLAYAGGDLLGYCAIDRGHVDEICGMVAPEARRRGIGRALLTRAHAASRARRAGAMLITEEVAPGGAALARGVGATLAMTELRLGLFAPEEVQDRCAASGASADVVRLRPATADDADGMADILAAAFNERPAADTRANILKEMGQARYLIGEVAGQPIGTLKVYPEPDVTGAGQRAGIYGFGVRPEEQGRGYGRQMLVQTLRLLFAEGYRPITLEVLPENTHAYKLYTSVGMRPITTYHYYRLPLA